MASPAPYVGQSPEMLPPSRSADAQITSRLRSPSLGASPARDKKIDSGLGLVRRLRRRAGLSVACRAGAWGGEADTPAEDTVAGRYRERHRDVTPHYSPAEERTPSATVA